ncbi:ATP-dependent DNA helicase Q-like 1 protein [Tanacetum coccineum]
MVLTATATEAVRKNTLSKSIESYYQESVRVGRHNLPSECLASYQKKDLAEKCRRQMLLERFGESFNQRVCKTGSNPCDNCRKYLHDQSLQITANRNELFSFCLLSLGFYILKLKVSLYLAEALTSDL